MKPWSKGGEAQAKRRLDRLFSELILFRDHRLCQWCKRATDEDGKKLKVDNSHIIPREVLRLRWDERNSVAVCFRHHKSRGFWSWHSNPLLAAQWIRKLLGDTHCDELLRVAQEPYEFTFEEFLRIERLLKQRLLTLSSATLLASAIGELCPLPSSLLPQ